ncbi:MAG: hypothetical protein ACM3O7_01540 [Acidobacteriota bacterium]
MRKLLAALAVLALVGPAEAAQVRRFALDTTRNLAGSEGRGIAVFPDGSLRPVGALATVASFDEPLGLALAVAADGTVYVGTGHPARVWRVRAGKKELVGELEADQITALVLDPKGTLYASTAVPALLVRLPAGAARFEVVTRLAEGNLWDLAWFQGHLIGAAGNPGRLLRLAGPGFEKIADIPDTHARCLAVSGNLLYIGTSGKGLVMRWDGRGPLGVLADSSFTEIASLAVSPDGTVWAAALTGDPTMGKPAKNSGGEPTVSVTEENTPTPTPKSEKGPATSEILRILPSGATTTAYRFAKQLADAVAWGDHGLVVGTGLDGEIWQLVDGDAAQLDAVDAAQVVRLAGGGKWALTQGPVKLVHRSSVMRGTFASPVLDAALPAEWGEVAVRRELPPGGTCTLQFRSGATAEPGDTWSQWTTAQACDGARVEAPPARFLQWRIELAGAGARVERVEVAYRQVNLAPEIGEFTVYEPGEVFLKTPPPSDRIVEVQHPDLSGIFTTLDDNASERQATLGKRYYRVGYQSLSWKVGDPNNDPLRFTLEVQPAGSGEWWTVRTDLDTTVIALDTQALPDGLYRFRLTASDEPGNPDAPATAQALSSYVTVDNTPPHVTITRDGKEWLVRVEDALSTISIVEWNRDADSWHPLVPADGALGGKTAVARIPVKTGPHVLAVRAIDDHHNRAVASVEEKP